MRQINYDKIIYKAFGETVVSTKYKGQAYGEGISSIIFAISDKIESLYDKITSTPSEIKEIKELIRKNYDIDIQKTIDKILKLDDTQDLMFCSMLYKLIDRVYYLYHEKKHDRYKELSKMLAIVILHNHKDITDRIERIRYKLYYNLLNEIKAAHGRDILFYMKALLKAFDGMMLMDLSNVEMSDEVVKKHDVALDAFNMSKYLVLV